MEIFNFFNNQKHEFQEIDVNLLEDLGENINLIDIREEYEYQAGKITNSKNIPMGRILENPEKYLNRDEKYYIMCQSGARSFAACKELSKKEYNVVNVKSGFGGYKSGGNKGVWKY